VAADPSRTGDERSKVFAPRDFGLAESLAAPTRREVARRLIAGPLARLAAGHDVEAQVFPTTRPS
jgi:hypothetical protein